MRIRMRDSLEAARQTEPLGQLGEGGSREVFQIDQPRTLRPQILVGSSQSRVVGDDVFVTIPPPRRLLRGLLLVGIAAQAEDVLGAREDSFHEG